MTFRFFAILTAVVVTTSWMVGCDSNGDDDETLVFAFQPQANPDALRPDAEELTEFISEETGYDIEIYPVTNYATVVEALRQDNADVAYFSGLPYMRAHEMADAELLVAEERDGQPFYQSQWYALESDDIDELSDLEGKSVAFTSPTSTSGYLFPMAEVIDQGLAEQGGEPGDFFGDVRYAGGYEQALRALANEQVDAAAASDYALELYLSDDQRDRIEVIAEQGPVPTHGLAIRSEIDDEIRQAILDALLALNEEENTELLESVYGAERLVERDHDEYVEALQHAYDIVEVDVDY